MTSLILQFPVGTITFCKARRQEVETFTKATAVSGIHRLPGENGDQTIPTDLFVCNGLFLIQINRFTNRLAVQNLFQLS